MKKLLLPIFIIISQFGIAQDSIFINKNFQFKDGIYLTFEEFQQNQPTFDWKEVASNIFTNPQTFLTQVASIFIPEGNSKFELDTRDIYALSLDGIPYVQVKDNEINRELPTFAALKVRGKICYFAFPTIEIKTIAVHAYNPKNGIPFRSGTVEREQEVFAEKMLHFETGEIQDFSVSNFLNWIEDDKDLIKTITNLSPTERKSKLFKCLLIYDDRNRVYLGE